MVPSVQLPLGYELRSAHSSDLPDIARLDDDASVLYERAGMSLSFDHQHPFVVEERARWLAALERGDGRWIATTAGRPAAFAIFGDVDGLAYLDQLSVHPEFMRQGLGRALVLECIQWARGRDVWLTTYRHLPWNAPYYARLGFELVPESEASLGLRALLHSQRSALPDPEQRSVMVHRGRR